MTAALDDLFNQIIHSEKRAHERKNFLAEIKSQVKRAEEELKDLEEETKAIKGKLVLKVQKLNQETVEAKLLQNREKILHDQRDELRKQELDLKQQLEDVEKNLSSVRDMFCKEMTCYSHEFSLVSHGAGDREEEAATYLKRLEEEEARLSQDLQNFNCMKSRYLDKVKEKEKVANTLQQLLTLQNELCAKLEEEASKREELEEEKELVSSLPNTGPEFTSLQSELSEAKSQDLEERCSMLQAELQQLQQRLWHKQVLQRQQHHKNTHQEQLEDTPRANVNRLRNFWSSKSDNQGSQ